jgi:glycosyltransferase involved in cell wall biosynthesis
MLAGAGHEVEVFGAGREAFDTLTVNGALVHRVRSTSFTEFAERVPHAFGERHNRSPFDVIEAPEFQAEYRYLVQQFPEVPLVVKLHTPTFMIRRLMSEGWRYDRDRFRRFVWKMRNRHRLGLERAAVDDPEREFIARAALVSAPSLAIRDLVVDEWQVPQEVVEVLPYPFQPEPEFLAVPEGAERPIVLFLGRVEVRKGVVDLADAFELVKRRHPQSELWFVGADGAGADGSDSMAAYLHNRVGRRVAGMKFIGKVSRDRLPEVLAHAAVVALPSLWESFGLVALEAMAAARPTVVTSGTGMEEISDYGRCAVVVPPREPAQLARAITALLDDEGARLALGAAGRRRAAWAYSWNTIAPLQAAQYRKASEWHQGKKQA